MYEQFFGALTLQMKINTQLETLSDKDLVQLFVQLLQKLLWDDGLPALVERKVICTLASLTIKYELEKKEEASLKVIYCLFCNKLEFFNADMNAASVLNNLFPPASSRNAQLTASYINELLLELSFSIYTKENEDALFNNVFRPCSNIIVSVLVFIFTNYSLDLSKEKNVAALEEALNCMIAISSYLAKASVSVQSVLPAFTECMDLTVNCIALDEVSEKAMNCLADLLANYSNFITQPTIERLWTILTGPWGETHLQQELEDPDSGEENDYSFLNIVIGFAEAMLPQIIDHIQEEKSIRLLYILASLLSFPGYAIVEEKVSWRTLEFWTTLIEDFSMSKAATDPSKDEIFKQIAFSVVEKAWWKMLLPSPEQWNSWPSSSRDSFNSYRRDLGDLLESSYSIFGERLYAMYITTIENFFSDGTGSPQSLEVSFYCLCCILEYDTNDSDTLDAWLTRLFETSFAIKASAFQNPQLLKTCSQLLSSCSCFLQNHPQYLNISLPVLFDALHISETSIQMTVSRSIHTLCTTCASHLLTEIDGFMAVVEELTPKLVYVPSVLEKIYSSVGYVTQRIEDIELRISYLMRLLNCILAQLQPSLYPNLEIFENVLKSCLQSVAGVALSQSPIGESPIIDVEQSTQETTFWQQSCIAEFQAKLISFLTHSESMALQYSDVVGLICKIMIAGLNEVEPSPFSLPIVTTIQYFCDRFTEFPAAVLLTLGSAILTCPYGQTDIIDKVLIDMCSSIQNSVVIINEESFMNNIDITVELYHFFSIILQKHPSFLETMYPDFTQLILNRAINLLGKPERLLESAAGQFIISFITSEKSDLLNTHTDFVNAIRSPLIAKILLGFGGNASRSSLPLLSDILGKLKAQNFSATRACLTQSLEEEGFPSRNVSNEIKRRFLTDLLKARIKDKVKQFWILCKGLESTPYGNSSWTF